MRCFPRFSPPNQRENLLTARGDFHSLAGRCRYHLGLEGHLIGTQLDGIGDSTSSGGVLLFRIGWGTRSVTKERGAFADARRRRPVGGRPWASGLPLLPTAEVRFRLLDDVFRPVRWRRRRHAAECPARPRGKKTRGLTPLQRRTRRPPRRLQHTNRALEVYGGVRGKFTRDLAFNAQARTVTYRDFGYWVNEPRLDSTGQRFSLAFDTLTVASVIGEAGLPGSRPLELSARVEFNTYGTGQQAHAWYQPRTRMSASARWNVEELLFIEAGIDVVGARYALPDTLRRRRRRRNGGQALPETVGRPRVRRRMDLRAETARIHGPGPRCGIPLQWSLGHGNRRPDPWENHKFSTESTPNECWS